MTESPTQTIIHLTEKHIDKTSVFPLNHPVVQPFAHQPWQGDDPVKAGAAIFYASKPIFGPDGTAAKITRYQSLQSNYSCAFAPNTPTYPELPATHVMVVVDPSNELLNRPCKVVVDGLAVK